LIQPAEKLMRICESVGARVTFFMDVCEYWAFQRAENKGLLPENYTPATWIKNQLKVAVKKGHDVQLHIHPQWIDHAYVSPTKWNVNLDLWRLPHVPGGYGDRYDSSSLLGLFTLGRKTLEDLLKPIKPDYECRAFRAGAWCIQPEKQILQAMREAGIYYDTTVVPGLKIVENLNYLDFTQAPWDLPCWRVNERVDRLDQKGSLLEIPIFSDSIGFFKRLLFQANKSLFNIKANPSGCLDNPAATDRSKGPGVKLLSIFATISPQVKMFNYCNASVAEMKYFIRQAHKRFKHVSHPKTFPIVAIGHPKLFGNAKEFEKFLHWVVNQPLIDLDSLGEKSLWGTRKLMELQATSYLKNTSNAQ
jgi:hypothetical protein